MDTFGQPIKKGALYGFRADGEYAPDKGVFFNKHKLLLDPYTQDFYGEFTWSERHYGQMPVGTLSEVNNAIDMPKSRVGEVKPYSGKRPNHSWGKTVIYECHVKGATCRHPDIPKPLPEVFSLSHPRFIEHLRTLGITCLELLPVQALSVNSFLLPRVTKLLGL